jgi:hypothetical protein
MNRRLVAFAILSAALVRAAPLAAQTDSSIAQTRGRLRGIFEQKVRSKLPLSQNEAQVFWPLFREYREETAWGRARRRLFEDFVESYPTLDDAQAASLLRDWMTVQAAAGRTKPLGGSLSGRVARQDRDRFFQLENQFDTLVQGELAKGIPLVKVTPQRLPRPPAEPLRPNRCPEAQA